jgi:hypothetical protein
MPVTQVKPGRFSRTAATRVPYDYKMHGVGVQQVNEPDSVIELFRWVKTELLKLHDRIDEVASPAQDQTPKVPVQ